MPDDPDQNYRSLLMRMLEKDPALRITALQIAELSFVQEQVCSLDLELDLA